MEQEYALAEIRFRVAKEVIVFLRQRGDISVGEGNALIRKMLQKYNPPISSLEVNTPWIKQLP